MDKLTLPAYLDHLKSHHGLKNDRALSLAIGALPSTICKLRKGKLPLTPLVACHLNEHLGISMIEIRGMLDPAYLSLDLQPKAE